MTERVDIHDQDTDSAAFVLARGSAGQVRIGLGIEKDGDLDLVLSAADARRMAGAIVAAAEEADRP